MAIQHRNQKDIMRNLRAENASLRAELEQAKADIEYISMMLNIELTQSDDGGANDAQREI